MTKNKLLELYQKLKNEEIKIKNIRTLRNYKDEDINIILNSKYPYVMINLITNYEFKLLKEEQRKEIIELINNAKSEDIASSIYYLVRSKTVLSSGLTVELAKIISSSEEVSVMHATNTALNTNVLLNKDALELVRIVGSSKEEYQASCSSEVAKNIEVLMSGEVVEITTIASRTEGTEQSSLVYSIAQNKNVTSLDLGSKLVKLGSKIKSDESAKLITAIANNKILEKNNRSVYYLTRMLSTETYEEIFKLYTEAQKLISLIKEQESLAKNDNGLFWNLYKENPEGAIALLIKKYDSRDEITKYTRVRRKK